MSPRLFAAARLPRRDDTPIAHAERLARFVRDKFAGDLDTIRAELFAWRDRDGLPLTDALLELVAEHAITEGETARAS